MKRRMGRPVSPQRAQRMRRVISALHGEKAYGKAAILGLAWVLILGSLQVSLFSVRAETPSPTQTTTAEVVTHLLDANSQPRMGVTVNLVLIHYGDNIDEIPFGSCVTDTTGSCSITVSEPPHLRSGRIEGFVDLGEHGRQLIGWKGDHFEITLQLYPDRNLATVPAPLDRPYEGQTEQPTDAPRSTHSHTPMATVRPVPTATAFLPTATPAPPTATVTATATARLPSQVDPAQTPNAASEPVSNKTKWSGWAWIGLGWALFIVLCASFTIFYYRQSKNRQSE